MNDLTVFKNESFGEIRTLVINGEPWFVGKDVAVALGYSNPRKALGDHVDDEDKGVTKCDTLVCMLWGSNSRGKASMSRLRKSFR